MVATLRELSCEGKRVLLRLELNVPMKDGKILDDRRIRAAIPTLRALLDEAKQVIIMAHAGRPEGKPVPEFSLQPVGEKLAELLGMNVAFVDDSLGEIPDEKLVLLENLRFHKEEQLGAPGFAKQLASKADVYVNDAFGTLHREDASVVAVTKFFHEKAAGLLIEKELKNLDFSSPERPFIAILGAAKISGKIELIEALLEKADKILIGGGMVFTFLKAQGLEVGTSLFEEKEIPEAKRLLEKHGDKIVLPKDIVISEGLEGDEIFTVATTAIPPNMKGLDIGDQSEEEFEAILENAATVFWNGPMGVFETPPFDHATKELALFLAKSKARVVVGGGDTARAVDELGLNQYYAHVSTGGGAALQYIATGKLPGLDALGK